MCLNMCSMEEYEDSYDSPAGAQAGRGLTLARKVMSFNADRTGMINWEDNCVYKFSHHTFQEYLASRWMADPKDASEPHDFRVVASP